jgi:hypothetical protein
MRYYPRDTAAAKRHDGLGAGRSGGYRPTSERKTMHALSQVPRISVIAWPHLVHQAGRMRDD